jgi:hypothetical protein
MAKHLTPLGYMASVFQTLPDHLCHRGREGFSGLGVWWREADYPTGWSPPRLGTGIA